MQFYRLALAVLFFGLSLFAWAQNDSLTIYMNNGGAEFDSGHFLLAEKNFIKAAQLAEKTNPAVHLQALNNLGNILGSTGRPEEAIRYYQEALRHVSSAKSPHVTESKILKNIGATYSDLEDFKTALSYLKQAEAIAMETGDAGLIADCLNNKGIIYEQTDSMPRALEMYKEALGSYRKLRDPDRLALVFINIGVVNKNLKRLAEAVAAYDSALFYSRQVQNDYYIAAVLNNQGNVLMEMKQFDKAIAVTKEALSIGRSINESDVVLNALKSLSDQYHAKGDDKNAYLYEVNYSAYHDSLINEERVRSLNEIETKYQVEKKELELAKANAENDLHEANEKRNNLYILILIILIALVVLGSGLWMRIRVLRQKKHELELVAITEKQERERIAKDMHDELGSGISRITWITANAMRHTAEDQSKQNFHQIENLASGLSSGMKSLIWLLNIGDAPWTQLSARIREMANQICDDYDMRLVFADQTTWQDQKTVKQMAARDLFLIAKEAVNNSGKYAGSNQISISFRIEKDNLLLEILDNGRGFDPTSIARGHGLNNMEQRSKKHSGNFSIHAEPHKGTEILVQIPTTAVLRSNHS